MMEPDGQMFCPRSSLVISSKIEATHVVLKSTTFDLGSSTMDRETLGVQIFKEMNDCNDFTKSGREGDVLSLSSAECSDGLNLGFL